MNRDASRTVCVVGFHRSGTSLTARVLNVLGVHLGAEDDLLGPQEGDNARGYWEPTWMNDLNEEILEALGTKWWKPLGADPGWEQAPELAPLRERAQRLLEEKLGDAPLRGWKDPRSTLTLPIWKPPAGEARYVLCVRNPIDAIASLQRRPEPTLPVNDWGRLWLEYTARGIVETEDGPRLTVFYEDYFSDGAAQIRRLVDFLELDPGEERMGAAEALVESDLRHHTTAPTELAATGIPAGTRALYLGLRAAHTLTQRSAGDGDAAAAGTSLAKALLRVGPDLWWEAVLAQRAREAYEHVEAEIVTAREERDRAAADWRTAHASNNEISDQLEQARRRIAVLEQQLADASAQREHDRAQDEQALAAARAERDRERALVRDLQTSLSWRLTAPLRYALRRVREARAKRS